MAARLPAISHLARAALVLVRLQGLTLAEVGGILDRSPAVVKRQLDAAAAQLGADPYTVQAVLEALSWQTLDEDAVRTARRRAERLGARRRGRLRLVAVTLALVVIGGGVVFAVQAFRPLPARSANDWSYALSVVPPDGWQVTSHALTAHQESLELTHQDGRCEFLASLPSRIRSGSDRGAAVEPARLGPGTAGPLRRGRGRIAVFWSVRGRRRGRP